MGLTLYLLHEDSSPQTMAALQHLTKAALKQLGIRETHAERHLFSSLPGDEHEANAIRQRFRASNWQGQRGRTQVARWIAAQLVQTRATQAKFVWHVDGEVAWSKRATSTGVRKQQDVLKAVGAALASNSDDPQETERVVPCNPYYNIEAWTYQNFSTLRRLVGKPAFALRAHQQIDEWALNRGALDDVARPGEDSAVGDVVGKAHNLELVERGWPAQEVYEAGASFAAFVDALRVVVNVAS